MSLLCAFVNYIFSKRKNRNESVLGRLAGVRDAVGRETSLETLVVLALQVIIT